MRYGTQPRQQTTHDSAAHALQAHCQHSLSFPLLASYLFRVAWDEATQGEFYKRGGANVLGRIARMLFYDRQGSVPTDGAVDRCGDFGEICQGDGGLVRLLVLLLLELLLLLLRLLLLWMQLRLLPRVVVFLLRGRRALRLLRVQVSTMLLSCRRTVHYRILHRWGSGVLFGRLRRVRFVGRGRGYVVRICVSLVYAKFESWNCTTGGCE